MPLRRLCLAAFVVYTLALLTATHWPGLEVKGPISRTDLVIHFGAFFVWTVLLALSGLVRRSVRWLLVAGLLFAAFDETTQPLFRRVYDHLDLLANWAGVAAACVLMRYAWAWLDGRGLVLPGREGEGDGDGDGDGASGA